MNKSQALKWIGKEVRIRPTAIRMTDTGERLAREDSRWLVDGVSDIAATIRIVDTSLRWELGLDNVREFRTPDFLLLRCQLTITGDEVSSDPIIFTSADHNMSGFEALLKNSWTQEFINGRELWISEVDSMFQIEVNREALEYSAEWTRRFPDRRGSSALSVLLNVQGVAIKEVLFVSCDGGRIRVPMPAVVPGHGDDLCFCYDRNSLDYKVGQVIGRHYIYGTLEGVAARAGITVS